MNVAEKIRRIYDRRPYPFGSAKALKHRSWTLNLEWVEAIAGSEAFFGTPIRILMAGCGSGSEAFQMRRRLPKAAIVAVDFSARSIALAKRLQRRDRKMRDIRFVVGDLADPRLPVRLGGKFDLIICHGVLSYIPRAERAMRNFARCLTPTGALYLGVNGSRHLNTRLRLVLPEFGYDVNVYRESARLRDTLRLCDAVTTADGLPRVSGLGQEFLSSDVFGSLNRSLALPRWVSLGRRAGLHFRGNSSSIRQFRRITEEGLHTLLIPRSRAQVCEFLERLSPSQFHRLVLSRKPEANPPWESRRELLSWRIVLSRLYTFRLPRPGRAVRDRLRRVGIASPALALSMEWLMPEWELELLRRGRGRRSVGSVLATVPLLVPFREIQKQLYLLYNLGVIGLLPPPAGARPVRGSAGRDSPAAGAAARARTR
jgi:SAM-dependent methyltransferase